MNNDMAEQHSIDYLTIALSIVKEADDKEMAIRILESLIKDRKEELTT